MPQGANTTGWTEVRAIGLQAGDVIRAARDGRHESEPVTIDQIIKGSTGPNGHNFVAATCQPAMGSAFTINVPSDQVITVLSRKAQVLELSGQTGRYVA